MINKSIKSSKSFDEIGKELRLYASTQKSKILQRFFKTGPGEYGEGDIFIGVKVPDTRKVAKNNRDIKMVYVSKLLKSSIHEERLLALLILIQKYNEVSTSDNGNRELIFNFYLKHLKLKKCINNWDLVDLSADKIVGHYLMEEMKSQKLIVDFLLMLSKSKNLWERRVAIVSTFYFIKNGEFKYTIKISKNLLADEEDLMHKAVGWMLREVGKRDQDILENFLEQYILKMPRTTLRYAIERFPEKKRKSYLLRK